MNRVKNPSLVPNAGVHGVGFVYKDKDTGKVFVHVRIENVIGMARRHREVNNYPVSQDFNQLVVDNICENAAPGTCVDEMAPTVFEKLSSLGKALATSARSGFKTLTQEQVQERQAICESCQYFSGLRGMFKVACKRCGCVGLKLHLASSKCPISKWTV